MPSLTTFHLSVHPFWLLLVTSFSHFLIKALTRLQFHAIRTSMSWIVNLVRVLAIERYVALLSVRFTRKLRRMPIKR